ncbi:glycerol kinase GlpK [Kordiimonas laminariae]|uniref:glycerol kinase GlpK n=1 Tax=Kordiimonas laminariae TaxID=2917717 RepID=UPI001FF5E9A5|nr:glycerol kinase GlpK [Kordiimonas laminariae]MCK0070368.1 glycerol kinase GlpK [Kordiimonas laminariae]
MKQQCILAMDQGTTSSRAIVFTKEAEIIAVAQEEFPQIYPADGWVEHDPEAIWETSLKTAQAAFREAENKGYEIIAIGITNQRETTTVWNRNTGKALYNAIVWQDRRTSETCRSLIEAGHSETVQQKTGLLLDPYFSATKVAWILDHVEGARAQAEKGDLAFGTIDSFLISRLTDGRVHATDATNASRTSLFNIETQAWDEELLSLFGVPASVLPMVKDSADNYGETAPNIFGRPVPILGVAGDQQAATIGQCCFKAGDIKSTYGTGCFVMLNTGMTRIHSENKLLSTVAYRLNGETTYALEGSIFIAGAAVQWLRDEVKLISSAKETEVLVKEADPDSGVMLVPAFTGLGAPYWNPEARGAMFGLTRASGKAEIVKATLESVCFQTADLLEAMAEDGVKPEVLKVDGGMVANDWMMQNLSTLLNVSVDRPVVMETTALGAAYLAGLQAGLYHSIEDISANWQCERGFVPEETENAVQEKRMRWRKAVAATEAFSV